MATEQEKKDEHAPHPKKGKGLIIAIIAAVVIAGGAAAFMLLKGKSGAQAEGQPAEETASHGGNEKAEGAAQHVNVFNLEPFIVNLQDNSGTRYLKLTVNLELAPGTSTTELTAQTAQVRDSLIILLSSKSYADIGTVEGKYQMRDEIVARVNQFLTKGKIKTAYFTEFVIQ